MSYTPRIRQVTNPDLGGGTLYLENGRPYQGPYVQDSAGNLYTGEYISETSKPLVVVYSEGTLEPKPEDTFIVHYPKPSLEEKQRGYFERYFLQNPVTKRIKEVSKESYQKEKLMYRKQPYLSYYCMWYIKRELSWKNEKAIEEGEKIMKSIGNQVLKSPLQFVE